MDSSGQANSAAAESPPTTTSPSESQPSTRSHGALARLAAERSIHGAAANDEGGSSAIDRARFVGRVEGAIRTAQQRDGRVNVRLSPPELGSLRIELTFHQGAMSARLETETTTARNLLLDNLIAEGPLVAVEARGQGRFADGREYSNQYAFVLELDGGLIRSLREYLDSFYISTLV